MPPIVTPEAAEVAILRRLAANKWTLRPRHGGRTSPLGLSYRAALVRLLLAGEVERPEPGKYRLTAKGKARLAATDSAPDEAA